MSEWQHEVPGRINRAPTEAVVAATGLFRTPSLNKLWLPTGHHWDMHIEHKPLEDGGPFTGGGWKLVWHTTESPWQDVDSMYETLKTKRAAPHVVIGAREGLDHPVTIQMIPFDRAGRALEHPAGTPPTNSANAIQVEICGVAAHSQDWPESMYKALANLTGLIDHRRPIASRAPMDFSEAHRMTPYQWIKAEGHVGHSMAPNNSHTDPGHFREGHLLKDLLTRAPLAL